MTDLLSTDCPARQLARQFIAKFKADDGVGKSKKKAILAENFTSKLRKPGRAMIDSFLATQSPWARMETQINDITAQCDREYGFGDSLNRNGILGRFGNHYIRHDPQMCVVGDAVPLDRIETSLSNDECVLMLKRPVPFFVNLNDDNPTELDQNEIMIFTKFGCEITSYNGRTFQTCWFWKRVE